MKELWSQGRAPQYPISIVCLIKVGKVSNYKKLCSKNLSVLGLNEHESLG